MTTVLNAPASVRSVIQRLLCVLACASLLLSLATQAHAYSFKISKSGHRVHWTKSRVEINVDNTASGPAAALFGVARSAAESWGQVDDAPELVVNKGTRFAWGFDPEGQNENGIYVLDAWPFPQGQLATTITTTVAETGEIVDSDILINYEYEIDIVEDEKKHKTAYDLGSIVTHEMGHLLGLGHTTDDRSATMWHELAPGTTGQRVPKVDDLAGLAAAYEDVSVKRQEETGHQVSEPVGDSKVDASADESDRATVTAGACSASASSTSQSSLFWLVMVCLFIAARRLRRAPQRSFRALASLGVCFSVGCASGAADGSHRPVIEGSVHKLDAQWEGGVIWTNYRVTSEDGSEQLVRLPGGKLDGLVQQVGQHPLPVDGQVVRVRVFHRYETDDATPSPTTTFSKAWLVHRAGAKELAAHDHDGDRLEN